jgi:hypothetical protein
VSRVEEPRHPGTRGSQASTVVPRSAWLPGSLVVLAAATAAFAEPPTVELPLGPYARPGRPLDVRVVGGADRIRAAGTPWALPQGSRGDEFLLELPAVVASPLEVTVEHGGAVESVSLAVDVLPAGGRVAAVLGDSEVESGIVSVRVPRTGLPTLADAWRLFDDVVGDLARLDPADRDRVSQLRGADLALLASPDPFAFAAAGAAAAASARLPRGVAIVAVVLSATELVVLGVLALRQDRPLVRALWLCTPAAACALWLLATQELAAPLRAVPLAIETPAARVVYVRIEALRDGVGALVPPAAALGSPRVVRWASDDRTVEEMETGAEVRMALRAGEVRVVAYVCQREMRPGVDPLGEPRPLAVPEPIGAWLARRGLRAQSARANVAGGSVPAGRGIQVLPGIEVEASPAK